MDFSRWFYDAPMRNYTSEQLSGGLHFYDLSVLLDHLESRRNQVKDVIRLSNEVYLKEWRYSPGANTVAYIPPDLIRRIGRRRLNCACDVTINLDQIFKWLDSKIDSADD